MVIAGSVDALLSEDDTRMVFEAFERGCKRAYGIDIRSKKTIFNARTLKQVKSFAKEFGSEDGVRIIDKLFMEPYNGRFNGQTVGASIFSKGSRWIANKLLLEAGSSEEDDFVWKDF